MTTHATQWIDYYDYDRNLYLTAAYIPEHLQLSAKCTLCGHRVRVYRSVLQRSLGRDTYMINVRHKLKCGLCTNRRHNRLLCRIVVP